MPRPALSVTRDTYDLSIRRASQLSHKLDIFRPNLAARRPSRTPSIIPKPSPLLKENFRGSDRTLVSSSLDSNNSSRSNINTAASSSYYSNSNADLRDVDHMEFDDDDDDDEDGLELEDRPEGAHGVNNNDDDDEDVERNNNRRKRSEELETDKGLWERKIHYILLSFGAVFGLRNILEFPALTIKHGGGAFLFVYVVLTYCVGLPIVYLEVSLGQYSRGGVVTAWRIMPLARGIAVSSLLLTLAVVSHSLTPAAWAIYYLYSAIVGWLPMEHIPATLVNASNSDSEFVAEHSMSNISAFFQRPSYNISHHHFYTAVLEVTDSFGSLGHIVSRVLFCLIVFWTLVFLLASMGPKNLAKVSFCFTAVPSVLMIAVLFIVACTLPGSVQGIQAFLNPKWANLSSFQPWLDALDLVLSGLACGTGILITLSGHCKFHGNTFRNAMAITSLSLTVTVTSGCLILALLGVEALRSKASVDQIKGLADYDLGFVLFPAATTQLPKPALWSGIFFVSVALFALIQGAVAVQHMQQGALDFFHLGDAPRKWRFGMLGILVVLSVALNVVLTAQNGLHTLRFLQLSVTRLTTPVLSTAQCLVVGWGYGARRFAGRVLEMTGRNKSLMWKWLWRWGCPVFLTLMIVTSFLTANLLQSLPAEDRDKKWLHGIGWALNPIILLPGLAMSVSAYFRLPGNFRQRLKQLRSTPPHWGPGHPEHEPQADLPDYVICHPDPFRPANALAMLTANLYLPNIINFSGGQEVVVHSEPKREDGKIFSVQHVLASAALAIPFFYFKPVNSAEPEMVPPSYLSAAANPHSDEDGSSASLASDSSSSRDGPRSRKTGLCGRCHASILCLSHVIGLGNVVRFPYLAYKHGGGAFLIAYFILLLSCGVPMVVMETAIGQYSSMGPIRVWKAVPIFKGVGYSMVAISALTSVYYGVISSWAMLYLVTSMTSVTPWGQCSNLWNTNSCVTLDTSGAPCNSEETHANESTIGANCTSLIHIDGREPISSSVAEYFYNSVVNDSERWGEPRDLRWQLCLCLFAVWLMVGLAFIRGVKPGEKATYFIVTLTTIPLLILFVRATALAGGKDGLRYLFTPQWSEMGRGQLWRDAATQVFFSLSLGSGTLVAMGTYNKFNNDLFTETVIVCSLDAVVSVMSSLVVFAVLGSLGHTTDRPLDTIARPDLGLPFVTLSQASLHLPGSLFWSGLSFLMLVVCGVFTCASLATTVVSALVEVFSGHLKKQRVWLGLAACTGAALLGLTLMVQDSFHVLTIFDNYLSGLPQLFTGALVVSAFAWIYGVHRFSGDVSRMINSEVVWCWRGMWGCVCPCLLLILIIVSLASLLSGEGDEPVQQPWYTRLIGLVPLIALQVPVVVCACHEVSKSRSGILLEKIRRACKTRREWGATERRCSSHVEYFPTVHTHMGIDTSLDGLNTVTDHVQFSPVGVRVPSLSQTSLLPVSPGMRRTSRGSKGGKIRDMRHTAILNHAYSNPQCNLSSAGSLEKTEKKKRLAEASPELAQADDVIFVKRKRKKVPTTDASTQTDTLSRQHTLFRQRSHPSICTPVPLLTSKEKNVTRSLSWHHLGGHRTVVHIDLTNYTRAVGKNSSSKSVQHQRATHNNNISTSNIVINTSSPNTNSSSSKNINTDSNNSSKEFSADISNDIVQLEETHAEGLKRNKNRSNGRRMRTRLIEGASGDGKQDVLGKPRKNKFNRSISCDDSNIRARTSSSSSSNSNTARTTTSGSSCSSNTTRTGKLNINKGSGKVPAGEKRRLCGQSVAPNLNILMRQSSLPQGNLPIAALACQEENLCYATAAAMGGMPAQNIVLNKRSFHPETGKALGQKCADTVVRLSHGKKINAEVCALSATRASKDSKSNRQFPGSSPVEAIVTGRKTKCSGSPLDPPNRQERTSRPTKPPLKRSESEITGRDISSETFVIRPVVSQPSISSQTRVKTANGYKAVPHTKRKRRSKSIEELATPEQQNISGFDNTHSLSRSACGTDNIDVSKYLKNADSLPAGFAISKDVALTNLLSDSPTQKQKTALINHVPALPLSTKDHLKTNASQIPLQQVVSRGIRDSNLSSTQVVEAGTDPAVIDLIDEGVGSNPTCASCPSEDGYVIVEETEIDLQIEKDDLDLLDSSSSLPSSLSSPSPSSTLLPSLGSCGVDSSNL